MLLVLYRRREVSQLERLAECEMRHNIKIVIYLFFKFIFPMPNFEKDFLVSRKSLNSLGEVVALFLSRTTP